MSAAPEIDDPKHGHKRQIVAGMIAKGEMDVALPLPTPTRTRSRPRRYNSWQAAQRLEWTFGCSIDDAEEVVNWDPISLDPIRFKVWKEFVLGVLHIGAKFGLQRQRTDDNLALMEVRKRLERHDKDGQNVGAGEPATE